MFAHLQGIDQDATRDALVDRLLKSLDLTLHADTQASELSGGNKRKLALAIAYIGNPRVILLDEPSAGVDPVSRRAMWQIITSAKTGRVVILTTHLMEEADAVCDHIGIMVNGALQCMGTSQHLKSRFGVGYSLELQTEEDSEAIDRVKRFVLEMVSQPVLEESFAGKSRWSLPRGRFNLPTLFRELVNSRERLRLRDFSLSQATLEGVFISFAKRQVPVEENLD